MRRGFWQEPLLTAAAATVIVIASVMPLVVLAVEAVRAGQLGPLGSTRIWFLFAGTAARSAIVAALALAVGVPLGVLLARGDVRGRRVALVLHAFPVFLPPFLLALGWFHLVGRGGLVGSAPSSRLLFGEVGLVAVLTLAFAPVVTTLTAFGLDAIDPTLEEAARVVARPRRVAMGVLLPLAWPTIALAALLVFVLAFSELGVPMFLRVPAYPAVAFARLGGIAYAPGEAFVLVTPLLGLAALLVALERWLRGRRTVSALGLRRDRPVLPLGKARGAATVVCWAIVGAGLAPIAALAGVAARGGGFHGAGAWLGSSVANGLVAAATAATIVTAVALIVGRGLARRAPACAALDLAAVLAFVTPAAALGVGLVSLWNRPATQAIYAGLPIIVVGFVARYTLIGIRPMAAAIGRAPPHLEDAARVSGAGALRRLIGIVAPAHARALAATWLLVAVFALRDLETAVLFYPPGGEPLTVRIFTLEANGPPELVAALATIHVAVTAALVVAGLLAIRRRS